MSERGAAAPGEATKEHSPVQPSPTSNNHSTDAPSPPTHGTPTHAAVPCTPLPGGGGVSEPKAAAQVRSDEGAKSLGTSRRPEANEQKKGVHARLVLTMALWGSAFPVSKAMVESVPHQVAAVLRFGFGGLVMVGWLLSTGGRLAVTRQELARTAVAGSLGVFGYNTLFFWGLSLAPSIDGSIIVPVFAPVLTTAFVVVVQREATSTARLAGLALGIGGAVVFLFGVGDMADRQRLLGDLVYLSAAVCWAAYTLVSKRMLTGDPVRSTALATMSGSVMLAVVAVPALPAVAWGDLSGGFWVSVAYLAAGPTAVAYVFYYRGVREVGPSTASVMMFLSPVFGAGGAALFLGEGLNAIQGAGAVLMVVGALLAVRARAASPKRVPAATPPPTTPSSSSSTNR